MRRFGTCLPLLLWLSLIWCDPAAATEVHVYKTTFGSAGSGEGQFNGPEGVAVNDVTHDVYVVDTGNNRVEEFTSSGAYVDEFNGSGALPNEGGKAAGSGGQSNEVSTGRFSGPTGIAVDDSGSLSDPSNGDVYVVDRGHGVIDKFGSSGEYLGQLSGAATGADFESGETKERSIAGVAVDSGGIVWVSIKVGPIYSFSNASEERLLSPVSTPYGGASEGLAVDVEDNLYFNVGGGFVKVDKAGETVIARPFCGDKEAFRAAYDRAGGEIFLDNLTTLEACSLDGAPIESSQEGAPFQGFGGGHLTFSRGVAVDASSGSADSGAVYATDQTTDDLAVFEALVLPSVVLAHVSEKGTHGVTLNGTVDPEGRPVTSCAFEYETVAGYEKTKAFGHQVGCSPAPSTLGSGTSRVAVRARLVDLATETEYIYRLVAKNSVGFASSTTAETFYLGPRLGGAFVTEVVSESATLHALIDPNEVDTRYYFEYGPTTAYGSFAPVSPPGVDIGSTPGEQNVGVQLQGLEPGRSYYYRVVVVQKGEEFTEPQPAARYFTMQRSEGAPVLPDGRDWELVSPASKKGALLELLGGGLVQAAEDGSRVAYMADGSSLSENPAGKLQLSQVLSVRTGSAWESQDLTLPGHLPEDGESAEVLFGVSGNPEYRLFSPNLERVAVEPQEFGMPPLTPELMTERTLYAYDVGSASFSPLVWPGNVSFGLQKEPSTQIEEQEFQGVNSQLWVMHFLAATPDLGHVVFQTPKALTPEAIDEETIKSVVREKRAGEEVQQNIYEWSAGRLQLVNVLPGGATAHGRNPYVRLAGLVNDNIPQGGVQRSVSNDGRRVAWAWGEPYTPNGLSVYKGLYVRDMVEESTVRVGGPHAIFQTMNGDGSKVFFLEDGDLYVYDFDTGTQTNLTAARGAGESSAGAESSAGVQELVSDVSEDGSYVYFVAKGVLDSGAVKDGNNLYLLRDTSSGWEVSFIATLSSDDEPDWYAENNSAPLLSHIASRVSPNGRYLAFMSDKPLTGFDNVDVNESETTEEIDGKTVKTKVHHDEEVYLFDSSSARLTCVSCDPTGARPAGLFDSNSGNLLVDRTGAWNGGGATTRNPRKDHWLAGSVPGWDAMVSRPSTYQPRYLTNNGRVFFDSPVGLVPLDTNGLEDVYEFEPDGVEGCSTSTSSGFQVYVGDVAGSVVDGCVGLVSSGTSSAESAFYDASSNGDDVFFDTTARLVGADYDRGYDVYDAHVCSPPCVSEPVAPRACESADSCRPGQTSQPQNLGAPPSQTFSGIGNVSPARRAARSKRLTRAERLAHALKRCRKKNRQRRLCERLARSRYGSKLPHRKTVRRRG